MMSGPVQRQPWFWAILTAVAALFIFTMAIVASNRDDGRADSTTVVRQPSSAEPARVVPVPSIPSQASIPSAPAAPATPTPPLVRERTIVIRENSAPRQPEAPRAEGHAPARTRESARDPESTTPRVTEIKEFRSTGLPVEIRYEELGWKAIEERVVTDPTTELKSIGATEDGADVWVPSQAVEPYEQIFVAVLDEEGKYVVYRKR